MRSFFYLLARLLGDLNALSTPAKTRRRVKNKIVGRALGKAGFWSWLWK